MFTASVVLERIGQLSPDVPGLQLQGAVLSSARVFGNLLASDELDSLEVFLSPAEFQKRDQMAAVAAKILPKRRRGKGALSFYPIHALPDIWADRRARILICPDLMLLARDRYLRDRFALGPMAISCQTHGLGAMDVYESLDAIARQPAVDCDLITCLSEACRQSLLKTFADYLPTPVAPRMEVVPNSVDVEGFRPVDEEVRRRFRHLLGLPGEGTLTLYLGRLTPNSKADLLPLLRQFAKVSSSNDHLLFAGIENAPGYASRLVEDAAALGLTERFFLRSPLEPWTAPLVYGAADVFVLPSDNVQECLANTVLEAMASGLPCLTSDWDGIRDAMIDGVTGFTIPTYLMPGLKRVEEMSPATPWMSNLILTSQSVWVDEGCLGDRLTHLLRAPRDRAAMGAAARERIEELYSWQVVGAKLFELWGECLEKALREDPTTRETRRQSASRLGLPIPFRKLFAPYATHEVFPNSFQARLSDRGARILDGTEKLTFYDETLSLIYPETLSNLLRQFSDWKIIDEAIEANDPGRDSQLFHIGLLVKRGALDLRKMPGP